MDWKLVPTRLTQNMADAAKSVDARLSVWKYDDAYQAMLAHAPEPPETSTPTVAQLQARVAELEAALRKAVDLAAEDDNVRAESELWEHLERVGK